MKTNETYDIVLLTDARYVNPQQKDDYIKNILLEDELVLEALESHGLSVTRKAWDDSKFEWTNTKYAVFRATWDYFDRYREFFEWFEKTSKETSFINTENLIRWNIDKHYLKDLQNKKVHIPKTLFIEAGETLNLEDALNKAKTQQGFLGDEFVIKPCIAGGARHTYKFHKKDWQKHDSIFTQLIAKEAMMLQEFQKRIVSEGEVSMMVFAGKYTHAILKVAKKGDFRVQDDFGGMVHPYEPTTEEITFAENAFKQCSELPLYGRADIFRDNEGELALAELEIFEPELWFRFYPEAATIFAKSIKKRFFS